MRIDNIFINPSHGNEPYILGANISKELSNTLADIQGFAPRIIMPDLYGTRQRKILQEEKLFLNNMIINDKIGLLSQPLLFKDADYGENLINFIEFRNRIETAVRNDLKKYSGSMIEINTGSMFTSGYPSFFTYPISHTELFENSLQDPKLMRQINKNHLSLAADIMLDVEFEIDLFFIPSYSTFSYQKDRIPASDEVPTPPLKPLPNFCEDEIPEDSVYVMFSGTGTQADELSKTVESLQDVGYNIIMPFWINQELDVQRAGPEVINHKHLKEVYGRAGWGTIWTCQNAKTRFNHLPFCKGDEPEVYFNCKTLDTIPMLEATSGQEAQFGTLDGIKYTADKILEYLS